MKLALNVMFRVYLIWVLISLVQMRPLFISDESSGWYEDVLPGTTGDQHVPKRSCQGFQTRWVLECFMFTPLLHDPWKPPAQTRLSYFLTQPLWWHSSKHKLSYCQKTNVLETVCLKEAWLFNITILVNVVDYVVFP